MFFDSWGELARVVIVGSLGYLSSIILLRISGKRTLAKMNAFDFLVTVALGSVLASMLLNSSVTYLEGITAFLVLIGGQFVITQLSMRSQRFLHLIKSDPTLIFHRGHFLSGPMRRERVAEVEVRTAIRRSGHLSLDEVEAVILETDGSFSVLSRSDANPSSLENVSGFDDV